MAAANDATGVFELITMNGRDKCWQWHGNWGGRDRARRPYFQVQGKRWLAYRLVYTLVHGNELQTEDQILHSCDHGDYPIGCCNPYHLRIGRAAENSVDRSLRERHGIPRTVVRAIRVLLEKGKPQHEIAELYGISREAVSAIAVGRSHQHVLEERGNGVANATDE
jgi:hypothetical protein